MSLYEVSLFMSLLGFGMGIMFATLNVCGRMRLFNATLSILVRYVESKRSHVF